MFSPTSPSSPRGFSSVLVTESPLNKQGNLTGVPRHVRDLVAILNNHIHDWNNEHLKGIDILIKIVDLKTCKLTGASNSTFENVYPNGLEDLCSILNGIFNEIGSILNNIENVNTQFNKLCQLASLKNESSENIFSTWPIEEYEAVSSRIVSILRKEAKVKQIVKESISHAVRKEELALFFGLWVHEPYLDTSLRTQIEAMVKETGHC